MLYSQAYLCPFNLAKMLSMLFSSSFPRLRRGFKVFDLLEPLLKHLGQGFHLESAQLILAREAVRLLNTIASMAGGLSGVGHVQHAPFLTAKPSCGRILGYVSRLLRCV